MNRPPAKYTPIIAASMRTFLHSIFDGVGVPEDKNIFLTERLVENDLRGVFSHGSRLAAQYVRQFKEGELNPNPIVNVLNESPATLVVDGDGGVGYYAAKHLTALLIPKAKALGIAAGVTRNHGHIGAAGIYARLPLEEDLFCYVTSGHQLNLNPGDTILNAAGGSPMAFGIPTNSEAPFVLDFGAMHDLYAGSGHLEEIIELAPSTVFRSFGLGCVCQAMGGFLCGVPVDPNCAKRNWTGANQGSFIIVVDLNRFLPIAQFKSEMDIYAQKIAAMEPLKGYDRAVLAGTLEWERAIKSLEEGIPVSRQHAETLQQLAKECGVQSPV